MNRGDKAVWLKIPGCERKTRSVPSLILLIALSLFSGCTTNEAGEILKATGISGGLIVHVGCTDGRLTAAMAARGSYLVQGLDPDEAHVEAANSYIQSIGVGDSVSIKHWPRDLLPYADNLVNLLVSEDLGRIPMEEVMRVLAPLGVAYLKKDDDWQKVVKPWPEEIDEWTHWLHGPDNNPVARDTRVGPPRQVQWIAEPKWPKSHDAGPSLTGMVSSGGRIFYIADDGPPGIKHPEHKFEQWKLFARDAFNGILLWKRPIVDWGARAWSPDDYPFPYGPWTVNPRMIHRRLIACGDRVYVTLGFGEPVSVIDAVTGTTVRKLPGTEFASEILLDGGLLYAVIDRNAQRAGSYTQVPSKSVVAVDPESGDVVWERVGLFGVEDQRPRGFSGTLTRLYLTSGGDKVFVLENRHILALEATTGTELWRVPRPGKISLRNPQDTHPVNTLWDLGSMLYSDGILFCWQPHLPPSRAKFWQYRMELLAISVSDGKALWRKTCGGVGFSSFASVYKARGLVWVQSAPTYTPTEVQESYDLLGLDPETGTVVTKHSVEEIFKGSIHHHRCYQNKATENYIVYSRNGLEYIDLENGKVDINRWVRGMCQYGIMPANGLVYAPSQPCACFPSARPSGYHAFAAANPGEKPTIGDRDRLLRGPAYGHGYGEEQPKKEDWWMYRHDQQRSGSTGVHVSAQLKQVWSVHLEEPITAPTVANNRVFAATRNTHRVLAMSHEDGAVLWSFYAGNHVDTPPTVTNGRVYFGTADGYVFCLRASDGALIWRFDANPQVRHILSYGNVESAWPVHGSLIVEKGTVFFCAGRSSYMDGGLYFYAIDAASGEAISATNHFSIGDDQELLEKGALGTFNDILVLDSGVLFLKNAAVDTDNLKVNVERWSYIPGVRNWPGSPFSAVGGFLDDSLFDRVGWILDHNLIAKTMVFNDEAAFGMNWRERPNFWHKNLFKLGESEYILFGKRRTDKKTKDSSSNMSALEKEWANVVPMRVNSLVLTNRALFVAGAAWSGEEEVPPGLFEGETEGLLWAVDPSNGEKLAAYSLETSPIWDGIAAVAGHLYIATTGGKLICLADDTEDADVS